MENTKGVALVWLTHQEKPTYQECFPAALADFLKYTRPLVTLS